MALELHAHFYCWFQMVQTYRSAKIQVGHRYGMSIKRKIDFYGEHIRGLEDVQLRTRENYIQYPPESLAKPCEACQWSSSSSQCLPLTCCKVLCSLQRTLTYNISFVILWTECRNEQKVIISTDCEFMHCTLQVTTQQWGDPSDTVFPPK